MSNIVRRKSWTNQDYFLHFTNDTIIIPDGSRAYGLDIPHILGKEGLLADDWQALTLEVSSTSIVRIYGKTYLVKE